MESVMQRAWLRGRGRTRPGTGEACSKTRELATCVTHIFSPILTITLGKRRLWETK